jgi:hypothetical protein
MQRAAAEICQATDYQLQNFPRMSGQFMLLFPIRMASAAFENGPLALRYWVERKARLFTAFEQHWGIAKQVITVSAEDLLSLEMVSESHRET